MSGGRLPPSLEDLNTRLRKARKTRKSSGSVIAPRGVAQALRLAAEMVATVVVGGVLGWLLDEWLDTRPWALLIFLFLGVVAGIRNAYRLTSHMTKTAGVEVSMEPENDDAEK